MEYSTIGNTNLKVSVVGLGCEGFKQTKEEVQELVDKASELGVNFVDFFTSDPLCRSNFGKAIKGKRNDWIIQGHLGTIHKNNQYNRTRNIDEVKVGFDDLLKRLETKYIDIGMIHYIDDDKDFDVVFSGPIIEYAQELKANGIITCIGISSHNPLVAIKAVKTGMIDVLLFSINPCYDMLPPSENVEDLWKDENYEQPLFNIDPKRQELYELCEREGVAITVMKAFGGGDLLDEKLSPFKVKMTTTQCVHYCLTRPGVVSVAAGCHSIEELIEATNYALATKEERDFSKILASVEKHTFEGNCVYCGHCAPCSQGIAVADVNKYVDLCIAQGKIPETINQHYGVLKRHASDCIACGQCLKNCPFGVDIIQKMQEAVMLFGK